LPNKNQENFQKKCIGWFEKILDIQNFRALERKKMNFFIRQFKDKEISSSQYHYLYREWIKNENNLVNLVNSFYAKADNAGCFKEFKK
jgi:hypothetical protein